MIERTDSELSENWSSGDGDFEIDWVIAYEFGSAETSTAVTEYRAIVSDLETHGLQAKVRHGFGTSLLILIRVPRNLLGNEVYRSRVKDWLHGIVHIRPVGNSKTVVAADTQAEALRSVYHLVTWTHEQGGAGLTSTQWERVTSSFPPQAYDVNRKLLRRLASKYILSAEDLDAIRALFGEKVAFYYAFIQSYSLFLLVPSAIGILFWIFSGLYSPSFSCMICLWGIVFVEYWKRSEIDLSIRWDVRGIGELKVNRPQYVWDKEILDANTGKTHRVFSTRKRLARQLLFLPFALLAGLVLGTALVATFVLEALISDVYKDTLADRWIFQFLPTILLSLLLPFVTESLTSLATRLSEYENYRTKDEFDLAQVSKTFTLSFITSFLPIIVTAYAYVPYGAQLLLVLIPPSWRVDDAIQRFRIDPSRLQEEVVYMTMTGQLMNFVEELVVPYARQKCLLAWRRYWRSQALSRLGGGDESRILQKTLAADSPHEAKMLSRLRGECAADSYDVAEDIMEMVVQFGYLSLFSPAWPLMPLGFLVNNWVELRGDFFKLSNESQRPPPVRADSIGHSVAALEFLTLLGSMSTAALTYMYGGPQPLQDLEMSKLLLHVFVAEQIYLVVKMLVSSAFDKIGSEAVRNAEGKRYRMRQRYLETFDEHAAGTSRRGRSRTFAGTQSPSQAAIPTIVVEQYGSTAESEYGSELAEQFWTADASSGSTADAGTRLIVALKDLHGHKQAEALTDEKDKRKWT